MAVATILLPNFNNERVLPVTFDYLRRNLDCSKYDFVMVDDGSEDAGVSVAKREITQSAFHHAEIIELNHEGIVPALNTGLAAAKTEFVVRIDGDATVETPDWISILLNMMRNQEVGVIGGQVIFDFGRVHSFGRSIFTPQGLFDMGCCPLEPLGQRTIDSIVYRPLRQFQGGLPYEVDAVLGVCVVFRRSDAEAIGGFDMKFNPVWIEDDDFALSIRQLGKRVLINPQIKVVHRVSLRGSRKPGETSAASAKKSPISSRRSGLTRRVIGRGKSVARALLGRQPAHPTIESFIPTESDPWRREVVRSHYANWKLKWGFDPVNPDMSAIYDRYWNTTFCRHANPAQLRKSHEFLQKFNACL